MACYNYYMIILLLDKMKKVLAAVFISSIVGAIPTLAEVDPNIHKLCIEAKDYAGCVRAMKGDTSSGTIRTINSQGADIAEGNQCTSGYAYIGGGNCQDVSCRYPATDLGHDQLIAGKKDIQGKDVWGCKAHWWYGAGELRLTGAVTRTTNNPDCPPGEPRIGFNNTCQTEGTKNLQPLGDGSRSPVNDDLRYDRKSNTQEENIDSEQEKWKKRNCLGLRAQEDHRCN